MLFRSKFHDGDSPVLTMASDINTRGLRCWGSANKGMSLNRATVGQMGMLKLRISDNLPMNSDQK